jgi:hypothetical protein
VRIATNWTRSSGGCVEVLFWERSSGSDSTRCLRFGQKDGSCRLIQALPDIERCGTDPASPLSRLARRSSGLAILLVSFQDVTGCKCLGNVVMAGEILAQRVEVVPGSGSFCQNQIFPPEDKTNLFSLQRIDYILDLLRRRIAVVCDGGNLARILKT